MSGVWEATAMAIRAQNLRSLRAAENSLAALKNPDGWYAEDHRKVISLRREILEVIDRHFPPSKDPAT